MLEIASQITLCLLLAALIGFIIGFIVAKGMTKKPTETPEQKKVKKGQNKKKPTTEVKKMVEKESIEKEVETLVDSMNEEIEIPTSDATQRAVNALEELDEEAVTEERSTNKPELLSAPKSGEKDALTQIKGIGPKVEEKLNEAGIYHFSQIASWTEANISWLERNTAFAHRAKKDLWVNQAKALV